MQMASTRLLSTAQGAYRHEIFKKLMSTNMPHTLAKMTFNQLKGCKKLRCRGPKNNSRARKQIFHFSTSHRPKL
ncbi:Uncharacterized protein TCM_014783 [Theobroma cacao]|uniref:Uncharacterized protein n=1 Tax=Theobroma cacao TaxID=3641 RepID=A0A061G0I7_THECC|nr:Uncharacterized protein TCM_014783 [Theobroma cacao]